MTESLEEFGDESECDCCGYKTTELHVHTDTYVRPEPFHLCDMCYRSPLGHAKKYPRQFDVLDLAKSLAWVANHIVAEIRKAKESP